MIKYFIIALAIWNVITFFLMGIDKLKAKKGAWRISEGTLLTCSFMMGGVGIALGAKVWHHKTQKTKFKVGIPLSIIFNAAVIYVLLKYVSDYTY